MGSSNRRTFLRQGGLGVAGALTAAGFTHAAGANNRVVVGLIGSGGMGKEHLRALATRKDVQVAWVCDADRVRMGEGAEIIQKATGRGPQTTQDLRRVLGDKTIQAVFIATPDHWHAPAAILACAADKHVYVEK